MDLLLVDILPNHELVCALTVLVICLSLYSVYKANRGLPPGPIGLPLVGYIPFLDRKAPYETLSRLADKYGPVYSIRLGSILTIVVSDPIIVRKLLSMEETIGRAPLYLTHGIMQGYGLICAEGNLWKEHRKFVLGFMRSRGMKSNFRKEGQLEDLITHTADLLIKDLALCTPEGINVAPLLFHHIGNSLNQLIFGLTYSKDDETWAWLKYLLEEGNKLIGVAGPLNFLPWLRFIPKFRDTIAFIKENQRKTHDEYAKIFKDIEEKLKCHNHQSNKESCLIEEYIKERREKGEVLYDPQLFHVAADMFGAGTETTVTTIQWHFLDLALNPDVQSKMRDEASTSNADSMRAGAFCQAALMETQRLRNTVPLGIPHGLTQDLRIGGFRFPKESMVLPLLWRIHRSPEFWTNPLVYDPRRFLDSKGQLVKHDSFMPFQTGRRMCIGEEFAKMVILRMVSQILLSYEIGLASTVTGEDAVEGPTCGITLVPKINKLVFSPIRQNSKFTQQST